MKKLPILFAGGGSGGHIAPLLAVIEAVQKIDPERPCVYVGLSSDLHSPVITSSKLIFEKKTISSGKLHRFVTFDQLRQLGLLLKGILQAELLLSQVKPGVVLCKGSMVSVPIARAAARRGIPIFSHETDVVPGLANRIISRYAKGIFTAFPTEHYRGLPAHKLIPTGQPIRQIFFDRAEGELVIDGRKLDLKRPIVSVVGGSQGARRLNELVQGCWEQLLIKAQVVQITGDLDYAKLKAAETMVPKEMVTDLYIVSSLQGEIPSLFQYSTVVISRAGGTLFELAATHSPVVLVPLSTAAQDHQRANAKVLESAGAARVVEETTATSDHLFKVVDDVLVKKDSRNLLAEKIAQFAHKDAAQKMALQLLKALE